MDNLHLFTINKPMREDVQEFLHNYLKGKIIERAFQGQPVNDIAEAKRVIDESFNLLVKEFVAKPDEPIINESE